VNEPISPDDKDWTWVLQRPCPECGFDASTVDVRAVGDMVRANAAQWSDLLDAPPAELRARPRPDRWSTLEYAAHVRDVFRLYLERLRLMLDTDDPLYPNWDQDETAVRERYGEQDPADVAAALVAAADTLAAAFDEVDGEQWNRPGRRSDGAAFTVTSFATYMIHDPVHHLWDVTAAR
jgi:DinB superfamily